MSKFKIGDRVRITSGPLRHEHSREFYLKESGNGEGTIVGVEAKNGDDYDVEWDNPGGFFAASRTMSYREQSLVSATPELPTITLTKEELVVVGAVFDTALAVMPMLKEHGDVVSVRNSLVDKRQALIDSGDWGKM